jgi:hypothetical protein
MDWTIAYWVKTTDTGGSGQWWAGKGIVDGEVAGVMDDFGTSLVGSHAAFGVGNPDTTITSTTAINDGQWHHVAAVRNAATGLMQLYVDGYLQASGNGPPGPKISPPNLRLGSLQTGVTGGFLAGTLADVQIFNRVLTAPEIAVAMNQTMTLNPVGNATLAAGERWAVTNSAVDPYVPPRTLAWSLTQYPAGAGIDSVAGVITWRPAVAYAGSTNFFTVQVADNGAPSLSATQSFYAIVAPLAKPQITVGTLSNLWPQLLITGDSGPDYIIQVSTDLAANHWQPVFTNAAATPPFYWTDTGEINFTARFYRVLLGP